MKRIKFILAAALSLVLCFGGCKPKAETDVPDGKTAIRVSLYEGGFGDEWLRTLANEFNNTVLKDTDYVVTVDEEKILPDSILESLSGGGQSSYQLYISEGNEWGTGIYRDLFEDLSDIAEAKVDGETGQTVLGKMRDSETWTGLYSKYGEGLYSLPWGNSILGFVIDHQEFIDRKWYYFAGEEDKAALDDQGIVYEEGQDDGGNYRLIFKSAEEELKYEEGDYILSAGHDGKYGTYDDGQPLTLEQFDDMIEDIYNSGVKPFIWGGGVDSYLDTLFNSVFATYAGEAGYNAFHRYDSLGGEVELVDGTKTVITIENGYLVTQMKALEQAYRFFEDHFDYNNPALTEYMHDSCKSSDSHLDAQNKFLLGYQNASTNPQSAILIDGNWWEKEASTIFGSLEAVNRGMGDREYRFMLLPELPGHDPETTKSVFSCTASGSLVVPHDQDATRLNYTKEFVKYLLRDESLRFVARTTGYQLAYDYTLTEEDKAEITPFMRNVSDIYADTENIEIKYMPIDKASSPLSYASDKGIHNIFLPSIRGTYPTSVVKAVQNYTIDEIVAGLAASYTAENWATYISQAQDNGFFTDIGD